MQILITKTRSSHRRCSIRKGVLKNFAKFTGKHLCQSLFFNKVAGLRLWWLLLFGEMAKKRKTAQTFSIDINTLS